MPSREQTIGELLEPRPEQPLPSLEQVMDMNDHAASLNSSVPSVNGAASKPMPVTEQSMNQDNDSAFQQSSGNNNRASRVNGAQNQNQTFTTTHRLQNLDGCSSDDEDWISDPYQERADEIGLSHRIPGIGHLGDLLTPPGWKPGDDPIHPKKARQLHKEACSAAKDALNASLADLKDLKGPAYEEACHLKDQEWQQQVNREKVIREERVKVYRIHLDKMAYQLGQARPEYFPMQKYPQSNGLSGGPSRQVPSVVVTQAAQSNGGHLGQAITLPVRRHGVGQQYPSPKLLSPGILDPDLHDDTFKSVTNEYYSTKGQIANEIFLTEVRMDELIHQMHLNDLHMEQCVEKYAPDRMAEFRAQRWTQPSSQLPTHWAQSQGEQGQYQGNQHLGNTNGFSNGNEIQGLTSHSHEYNYPEAPQNTLHVHDEPVELALSSPANSINRPDVEDEDTPRPTKGPASARGSTPGKQSARKGTPQNAQEAKKSTCWYAAELEKANLPKSIISAEAMQAGYDYDPYGPKRKIQLAAAAAKNGESASNAEVEEASEPANKVKKKRRKVGEAPPVPSFKMSDDAIKKLFSNGMPAVYTGNRQNPWMSQGGPTQGNQNANMISGNSGGTQGSFFSGQPNLANPLNPGNDGADEYDNDGTYRGRRRPHQTVLRKRKTSAERAEEGY
ncbi:MAG: hypothetical protein Q9212_000893 [Teloschistes hypoglaucus]